MKQDKRRKEKNKGITLIALVVIIILLLILATVSIAILTGDNGIIRQANKAKVAISIGEEKEAIALAYNAIRLEKDKEGITADAMNAQFAENGTNAEASGTGPIKIFFPKTGRTYLLDADANIQEVVEENEDVSIAEYVKIGDYVNYQPDKVTETYEKFGEIYTGYTNSDIGQDKDLKWRVLNINSDGTVELISDRPITSASINFKGARGYNNGVAILNDYCKTMYSNASKGAVGRSLNIEDIQKHMKVNEDGKKAYENYTSGTGTIYKEGTLSYSSNKWYPLQWKNDNGVVGESTPMEPTASDIKSYTTEENAKKEETNGDLTITQTYWILNSSAMSSNFEVADTRDSNVENNMYYELLCNNGNSYYWLASRYTYAINTTNAYFGLRRIGGGMVSGSHLFYSNDRAYKGSNYIRPVVTIKSDIVDIDTDYETEGTWKLK